jgi:hypothetical protein
MPVGVCTDMRAAEKSVLFAKMEMAKITVLY